MKLAVKHWLLHIILGLIANLTEFATSLSSTAVCLPTVYFSIGFVSIQRFIDGEIPTAMELHKRLELLSEKAQECRHHTNHHYGVRENFRKIGDNFYMVDYGDLLLDGNLSLSSFLTHWERKFSAVLCPIKKPSD